MEDGIDKQALHQEVAGIARELIEADQIERAAKVLADLRKRFGNSSDDYLRRGLPMMLVFDLIANCRPNQSRRVAYIIDEHLIECCTRANRNALRERELLMHQRSGDAEGIAKCLRFLDKLDSTE